MLITEKNYLVVVFLTQYLCSQSYRNHAKKISGNFKNLARVGLAVLKKIVIF